MKIKSHAKVNIFLKMVGIKDNYHLLKSRFMKVDNLYDEISFEKSKNEKFTIEGNFSCKLEQNTIYKVYHELKTIPKVEEFFKNYKVIVKKNIPEFAGLGGGSSNCASFLLLTNRVLNLALSQQEMLDIGKKIGSDVSFFLYDVNSANVSGVGEVVEIFDEELLNIKTLTPPIKCSTKEVYQTFRKEFLNFDLKLADKLITLNSEEILTNFKPQELNDLLPPALSLYPSISQYLTNKRFFSGSGSSVFWRENE